MLEALGGSEDEDGSVGWMLRCDGPGDYSTGVPVAHLACMQLANELEKPRCTKLKTAVVVCWAERAKAPIWDGNVDGGR